MKGIFYFLTRFLFFFFSYELEIIDPPNRKSVTKVPVVFRVHGSNWWKILLGAASFLVIIAGLAQLTSSSEVPSTGEIISYSITGVFVMLAFLNQMILSGQITLQNEMVEFNYRNIFCRQYRIVDLSDFDCIWVQKMKKRAKNIAFDGTPYVKIRLKHSWTRFRSIELCEGPKDDEKTQFYSKIFNLPIKESFITIRGKNV